MLSYKLLPSRKSQCPVSLNKNPITRTYIQIKMSRDLGICLNKKKKIQDLYGENCISVGGSHRKDSPCSWIRLNIVKTFFPTWSVQFPKLTFSRICTTWFNNLYGKPKRDPEEPTQYWIGTKSEYWPSFKSFYEAPVIKIAWNRWKNKWRYR